MRFFLFISFTKDETKHINTSSLVQKRKFCIFSCIEILYVHTQLTCIYTMNIRFTLKPNASGENYCAEKLSNWNEQNKKKIIINFQTKYDKWNRNDCKFVCVRNKVQIIACNFCFFFQSVEYNAKCTCTHWIIIRNYWVNGK